MLYRIFRRIKKCKRLFFALLLILMIVQVVRERSLRPKLEPVLSEGLFMVKRVVDGDTILLANGQRIRLIGVDSPESVKPNSSVEPFGPEASEYTKSAIQNSRNQVRLRFDRERQDKYGRKLAYVYVYASDGSSPRLLNEDLIRQGLGRALLTFNYAPTMKKRFDRAQQEAQQERRGIWSLPSSGAPSVFPAPYN